MIETPLPILYSFRRCPYAMRTRLALLHCNLAVELREVVLRDKPQSMLDISPKATVPVLWLKEEDRIIDESIDIMIWAFSKTNQQLALPERSGKHPLIAQNDSEFKQYLDRYKYPNRYNLQTPHIYRDHGIKYIYDLDMILKDQPALSGEDYGFLDFAIIPFIRQFANVDRNWFDSLDTPALHPWFSTFLSLPIFQRIMTKYPKWAPKDEPITFGK